MAVTSFTSLSVSDGFGGVPVETFFTIMTVSASGVMSATMANASAYPTRQFEQLHVEPTPASMKVAVASYALVALESRGTTPRPVEVEPFALLAIPTSGVMGTITHQFVSVLVGNASGGMTVAFASAPNCQVGNSVAKALLSHAFVIGRGFVQFGVKAVKDHLDVRGSDPILQDRGGVEVVS